MMSDQNSRHASSAAMRLVNLLTATLAWSAKPNRSSTEISNLGGRPSHLTSSRGSVHAYFTTRRPRSTPCMVTSTSRAAMNRRHRAMSTGTSRVIFFVSNEQYAFRK